MRLRAQRALTWLGILHVFSLGTSTRGSGSAGSGSAGEAGAPIVTLLGAIHHPPAVLLLGLMVANLGAVLIAAAYAARFRDTLEAIEAETRARVLALSRLVS